jgi:hypothetical protein
MQCSQETKKGFRCKNTSRSGLCHVHSVKFNAKSFPKTLKKAKSPAKSVLKEKRELLALRKIERQMDRHFQRQAAPANVGGRVFVPFFDNLHNAANVDADFELERGGFRQ